MTGEKECYNATLVMVAGGRVELGDKVHVRGTV